MGGNERKHWLFYDSVFFFLFFFFFFLPVSLDIVEHKSEKDSVINLGFLSLTFRDFQHFAIIFHFSPNL